MNNTTFFNEIGIRLKSIRKSFDVSVKKFSEKVGISTTAITNYESGKRPPTGEYISTLINDLKISPLYLFFGIEPMFYKDQSDFTGKIGSNSDDVLKDLIEYQRKEIQELKAQLAEK